MLIDNPQHTNFFATCLSLFGVVGLAGNFRQVNPAWKKVLGYTTNDIYKSLYLDLVHPRDKAKTETTLEQLSSKINFVSFTNRFRRNDGTYRDILWEATRSETEPVFYVVGVDISVYNAEVQQEVKLAKEDFDFIMENKREGVLDWNLLTNQVNYSPRWRNIIGYHDEDLSSQMDGWYARIHPNDYSKVIKEVELCLKDKTLPIFEKTHRLQHKEGSYRWVHSQGTVLRDNTGQAYRFLISFIDITERKLMEDALSTSEKYAKLFMCQADAILLVTQQGKILDANAAATKLYGYSRDELLSFNRAPIFTENEKQFTLNDQTTLHNGYQRRKDGSIFPMEMMVGNLEWQGKKLFILTVRDVTASRKALEAVAESEMKYRTLFESHPDALVICEATTQKIVEVNTAAIILYGYNRDEWQQLGIEILVTHSLENYSAARLGQKTQTIPLEWHIKKDGVKFPVEISWSSYKFKNRPLMCFTIRDVTVRKQKEEELYKVQVFSHAALQTAPVFFLAISTTGKILTLNDSFLQAVGYSLEEVIDQDYLNLLVPRSDQLFVADSFQTALTKRQKVLTESSVRTKNKQQLQVEWHYRVLPGTGNQAECILALGININERKQVHQQLRLFKKMVESSQEAIVVRRLDGKLIYYNQAYEQLFKVSLPAAHNDFFLQCTEDTRRLFEQEITPQLQAGETWEGVIEVIDNDGQPFSVWQRIDAINDEQGNLLLSLALMHDVTEKQALEAHWHSEWELYETIFHAAPLALIYKDKNNQIVKANGYAAQVWKTSPDKLVGKVFEDFDPQRALQSRAEEVAIIQTGQPKLGILQRYQDRYYQVDKVPYQEMDGQISGVIVLAVDVTERLKTEIALQQERDQYETIFNAAPLAIMYKNPYNRFICVNQYAAQRWNTPPEKLKGMSFYELAPDYVAQYHADDADIIETGEPKFGTIAEYAEGFYWQVDKLPYRDSAGNILGILVFAVDITERLRLERRLRHERWQYETIVHAAPFAIWCKDKNDRLILANQYIAKLWETTPDKLAGMSFHDLEPEHATRYQASDLKVIYSGKPELSITEEYFQVDWLVHKIPYRNETGQLFGLVVFAMDITEHLQTEQSLRSQLQILEKKEASLRHGIEKLPIMVYAINGEGNLALWNRKCEQVTGYSAEDMIDNPKAWELLYPNNDYRENMLSTALELLKHHENWQHWQWTLTCQDGNQKTIAWSMNQIAEQQDRLSVLRRRFLETSEQLELDAAEASLTTENNALTADLEWVIGEDITEHEQTLQDLLESERRLQVALENLPMMIDAADEDGRIVVWNHECERITGYAKVEIVGNPRAWELLYPDATYREQVFQTQTDMLERYGGIRQWELNVTCKDGSQRRIAWSVSNNVKMSGFALWFIGQDVTDQEQVLEQLCDSEERLWLLIQHMPVMLKAYNEQGQVILWNHHCEEVTGYLASDITTVAAEIKLLYPHANNGDWQNDWQAQNYLRRQTEVICKNGSRKLIAWSNVSKPFPIPGWYSWVIGEEVMTFKRMPKPVPRGELLLEAA
jgi:PAS domain S-box-containing protein